MQKGFAPILVVLLVAFIILPLATYLYFTNRYNHDVQIANQKDQEQQLSQTSTPSANAVKVCKFACVNGSSCVNGECVPNQASPSADISNWKTYTNSKYGFSFNYPSNLTINGDENSEFIEINDRISVSVDKSRYFLNCIKPLPGDLRPDHCPKITQDQKILVNGLDATQLNGTNGIGLTTTFETIDISHDNSFYDIEIQNDDSKNPGVLLESDLLIFNQIVSSFKFAD